MKADTCCCYFGYSGKKCECQYRKTAVCPDSDICVCNYQGKRIAGKKACLCSTNSGGWIANTTQICPIPSTTRKTARSRNFWKSDEKEMNHEPGQPLVSKTELGEKWIGHDIGFGIFLLVISLVIASLVVKL